MIINVRLKEIYKFICIIVNGILINGGILRAEELKEYLGKAAALSPDHPVVISKFIQEAKVGNYSYFANDFAQLSGGGG